MGGISTVVPGAGIITPPAVPSSYVYQAPERPPALLMVSSPSSMSSMTSAGIGAPASGPAAPPAPPFPPPAPADPSCPRAPPLPGTRRHPACAAQSAAATDSHAGGVPVQPIAQLQPSCPGQVAAPSYVAHAAGVPPQLMPAPSQAHPACAVHASGFSNRSQGVATPSQPMPFAQPGAA